MKHPVLLFSLLGALALVAGGVFVHLRAQSPVPIRAQSVGAAAPPAASASPSPEYVGQDACATCHQAEAAAHKGSHHDLAMAPATEASVLGDFRDKRFRYGKVTTKFFRKDQRFFVTTDGPTGALENYEVKFTFGVYPLQQYLLDVGGGRLQAFTITWDARPKSEGGQRWFHQNPTENSDYRDELHWTRPAQNWNSMCAECHSTNVQKNYDAEENTFQTTWTKVSVGCESCHGPASAHLSWAQSGDRKPQTNHGFPISFPASGDAHWTRDGAAATATRDQPLTSHLELETCARCHARRSSLTESYVHGRPLDESHLLALLGHPAFFADGQIREEDFEYASFTQSKMFHAGVTCTTCHEPHSQKLRAPGNDLCGSCHAPDTFNTEAHHHHRADSPGAACVNCHMPTTTFMGVHARHDHSIRIPRPDLSEKLGVPSACTQCHTENSAVWASEKTRFWYGTSPPSERLFGEVLLAGQNGTPNAANQLLRLAQHPTSYAAPLLARAAAVTLLAARPSAEALAALPALLRDPEATLRRSALAFVEVVSPDQKWALAKGLLDDPNLSVRAEAARILAPVVPQTATDTERQSLNRALSAYLKILGENAEQPQTQVNLALLHDSLGDSEKADAAYRNALRLDPLYLIATINYADFCASHGDEAKAGNLLLGLRKILPPEAALEHALGLHYVRMHDGKAARAALENAARLDPNEVRYGYVVAIAVHDGGDSPLAVRILETLTGRFPHELEPLLALIGYLKESGAQDKARIYAQKALQMHPELGSIERILTGAP